VLYLHVVHGIVALLLLVGEYLRLIIRFLHIKIPKSVIFIILNGLKLLYAGYLLQMCFLLYRIIIEKLYVLFL